MCCQVPNRLRWQVQAGSWFKWWFDYCNYFQLWFDFECVDYGLIGFHQVWLGMRCYRIRSEERKTNGHHPQISAAQVAVAIATWWFLITVISLIDSTEFFVFFFSIRVAGLKPHNSGESWPPADQNSWMNYSHWFFLFRLRQNHGQPGFVPIFTQCHQRMCSVETKRFERAEAFIHDVSESSLWLVITHLISRGKCPIAAGKQHDFDWTRRRWSVWFSIKEGEHLAHSLQFWSSYFVSILAVETSFIFRGMLKYGQRLPSTQMRTSEYVNSFKIEGTEFLRVDWCMET